MSISVMGGEEINRKSLVSMRDYLNSVPGVTMLDRGPGGNQIVIRGVGLSQFEQSAVGAYFGEVPLTSPTGTGGFGSGSSTDMKMVDLERVEILRGPQSTLYGSGAMAGTIRSIPVAPKLNTFEGKVDVGYSGVSHSNDDSHKLVGVLNLPLIDDTLALRVVAYRFDTAGYIDRISTPESEALAASAGTTADTDKDVGEHTYTGGRATLLWEATDQLTLSLMGASQKLEQDGSTLMNTSGGAYTQYAANMSASVFVEDEFDLINLVANYDFAWATLVASYSHIDGAFDSRNDALTYAPFFAGVMENYQLDKKGDTVELRLSSQLEGPLQFVGGLYYEDFEQRDSLLGEWYGSDATLPFIPKGTTGPNGLPIVYEFPPRRDQTVEQKAVFGELVYTFNEQWALTAGARRFDYDRRDIAQDSFFGGTISGTDVDASEQGTSLKTNISYTPNDDSLIYLQRAEGFRVGQGQVPPPAAICDRNNDGLLDTDDGVIAPLGEAVDSDTTTNTELGGKFSLLDKRLTLNATLYRVDWEGLPIKIFGDDICGLGVTVNGGEAQSEGVELETQFYATPNLQLSLSASYMETEFLDDAIAQPGDRLPLSPRVNGVVGVDYSFELAGHDAFIRSDYSYISSFDSALSGNLSVVDAESYGKWNLRAGIEMEQWTLELYGNNLTNEDAITIGFNTVSARRLTPRTLGFDIGYTF